MSAEKEIIEEQGLYEESVVTEADQTEEVYEVEGQEGEGVEHSGLESEQGYEYSQDDLSGNHNGEPRKKSAALKGFVAAALFGVIGIGGYGALTLFGSNQPVHAASGSASLGMPVPSASISHADMSIASSDVDRVAALMNSAPTGAGSESNAASGPVSVDSLLAGATESILTVSNSTVDSDSITGMIETMVDQMDNVSIRLNTLESRLDKSDHRLNEMEQNLQAELTQLQVQIKTLTDRLDGGSRASGRVSANVVVPQDGMHLVKSGDTLASISRSYGVSVNDLVSLNGITNPSFLPIGLQIRVDGAELDSSQKARVARLTSGRLPAEASASSSVATTNGSKNAVSKNSTYYVAGMSRTSAVVVGADGNFVTVGVGDTLPGMGTVISIDMASNQVNASNGVIRAR